MWACFDLNVTFRYSGEAIKYSDKGTSKAEAKYKIKMYILIHPCPQLLQHLPLLKCCFGFVLNCISFWDINITMSDLKYD